MVRAYVMMDIEGVAGVSHSDEGSRGNPEYERARRLMTEEASAAIRGILEAEPEAEVLIVDSHGPYRNIIPELLDDRAILLRGKPRYYGMMDAIDDNIDFAMFIGAHGRGGEGDSVLSHTFTGHLLDIQINGVSHGEVGLNALMAAAFRVPVVMVTGDQHVVAGARNLLGSGVQTVQTKISRGASAAENIHPARACTLLQEAARSATASWRDATVLTVPERIQIDIEFDRPVYADLARLVDGCERTSGRAVRFERGSYPDAYRLLRLLTVLCSSPV